VDAVTIITVQSARHCQSISQALSTYLETAHFVRVTDCIVAVTRAAFFSLDSLWHCNMCRPMELEGKGRGIYDWPTRQTASAAAILICMYEVPDLYLGQGNFVTQFFSLSRQIMCLNSSDRFFPHTLFHFHSLISSSWCSSWYSRPVSYLKSRRNDSRPQTDCPHCHLRDFPSNHWYSRTPVSADSVSAVSVIRGLPWPENINTYTAKVDHGRFKYFLFNLPASTLVDIKFTLRFYI
jgi:hypothetical protein